jgi:hypothetical protein
VTRLPSRAIIVIVMRSLLLVAVLTSLIAGCASVYRDEGAAAPSPAVAAPAEPPPPPPAALAEPSKGGSFFEPAADELAAAPAQSKEAALPVKPQAPPGKAPPTPAKPGGKPAPAAPTTATTVAPEVTPPVQQPPREALLMYSATLSLGVLQVEAGLTHIEELTRSMGGYLASRSDAAIVVRVPRARFQELLLAVEKQGDVLHRNVQAEDVTDQVVDLELRLKSARAVRDRLAQLLQGATATKDALEIEKELARVMGEIESMEGKLKLFADKIAYSTVTVNLSPIHSTEALAKARLPFHWLDELGLSNLMQVQ